jgi:capsular exopolysaccharide synthesis family protein
MTYRDDPHSVPDAPHALVGGQHTSDALVAQSNGQPSAAYYSTVAASPPPSDVLRGAMDANGFFHCLRRRWLLAICMGCVMATTAAGVLWFLFPESSSATALFQVSSQTPTLVFEDASRSESRDFGVLQRTQLALLNSHFVLQAALRNPGIASLNVLAGQGDPVQWLASELAISFLQNSEVLSISVSGGGDSEELRLLVDAVAKAYQDEVIATEDQRRLVVRDALATSLNKLNREIADKMQDFQDLAKELGLAAQAYGQRDPESDLLLKELSDLVKSKGDLLSQFGDMQTNFMVMQQQMKDPRIIDMKVEEALASDPNMSLLQQQLMGLQMQLTSQSSAVKGGRSRESDRLQKQMANVQNQMNQLRATMRQRIVGAEQGQPNRELQSVTKEFQIRAGVLRQRVAELEQSIAAKTEELLKKHEKSVDLEVRQSDLSQLQEIARDMSIRLESFDVEAAAPARIRLLQSATITPGINAMTRYSITGMGGAATFAMACFGIAYLEFRNRRLNGPSQVDEGLGIRVVGTLPALSVSRALDPNHPVVAQLTESIDSIRTQLMHDSTSKRRQVVMVTSAATMEGRTIVASQLAASLARAGRRTLLVDGDVRRPALQSLFDVPLEDGLCEVLRAEVDVADVIRPTHAEGLWLLTAGYCDVDAIHALATEQMQPVFEKLRSEYDFIVIDGAPVLGMSDALIFGQYCDGAIISVRRDVSQLPKINEAAATLRSVGIRLIGAVVNGVQTKSDDRVTQLRLIELKSDRQLQSA